MKEYEFWLAKFYRCKQASSWRVSLFELQNHINGKSWTLFAFGVEHEGFYMEVAA